MAESSRDARREIILGMISGYNDRMERSKSYTISWQNVRRLRYRLYRYLALGEVQSLDQEIETQIGEKS